MPPVFVLALPILLLCHLIVPVSCVEFSHGMLAADWRKRFNDRSVFVCHNFIYLAFKR